jgi:hypothetical protein
MKSGFYKNSESMPLEKFKHRPLICDGSDKMPEYAETNYLVI